MMKTITTSACDGSWARKTPNARMGNWGKCDLVAHFIRHCHTDFSVDNNSFISDRAQKSDSILFVVHIFSSFEYVLMPCFVAYKIILSRSRTHTRAMGISRLIYTHLLRPNPYIEIYERRVHLTWNNSKYITVIHVCLCLYEYFLLSNMCVLRFIESLYICTRIEWRNIIHKQQRNGHKL